MRGRGAWKVAGLLTGRGGLLPAILSLSLLVASISCGGGRTQTKDSETNEAALNANVKKGVKPQADAEV